MFYILKPEARHSVDLRKNHRGIPVNAFWFLRWRLYLLFDIDTITHITCLVNRFFKTFLIFSHWRLFSWEVTVSLGYRMHSYFIRPRTAETKCKASSGVPHRHIEYSITFPHCQVLFQKFLKIFASPKSGNALRLKTSNEEKCNMRTLSLKK